MSNPHYNSAPRERMSSIDEFPTGTTITFNLEGLVDTVTYIKQSDGSWTFNDVPSSLDSAPTPPVPFPPEDKLPFGATARVEVGSVYAYVQYQQESKSTEWKLVLLKEKDGSEVYLVLDQGEYEFSKEPTEHEEINFDAVPLKDVAMEGAVLDGNDPAYRLDVFPPVKPTVRFRLPNIPDLPQVRIRNDGSTISPTRQKLAATIAKQLKSMLMPKGEDPKSITIYDKVYGFDDIVLLAVGFRSKGTLRQRLAVIERSA